MQYEPAEILVTVKAYPNVSKRYGEVVCVAGVRIDRNAPEWIRLYPVQFRELAFSLRFRKYQRIKIGVREHAADGRPESYRPNIDSLELGRVITTANDPTWSKRRPYIDPLVLQSMCEVQARQAESGQSLGVFKPAEIQAFEWEPVPDRDEEREAIAAQPSLLFPRRSGLDHIPYRFRYRYRCDEAACTGHNQSIIDWELAQAYRSWSRDYGPKETLTRLHDKWLLEIAGPSRDTHLFVGNQAKHPRAFLVLGAFWPKKPRDGQSSLLPPHPQLQQ